MKIWLNFLKVITPYRLYSIGLLKKEYVRFKNTLYHLSYNCHPECQRVKMELVKGLGIEDPGLWRICPKEYRHLLHDERRQELKTRTSLIRPLTWCLCLCLCLCPYLVLQTVVQCLQILPLNLGLRATR